MEDFKVGVVVQLKSGGPLMTITSIDGQFCHCTWFHENKPHYGKFPVASLVIVE